MTTAQSDRSDASPPPQSPAHGEFENGPVPASARRSLASVAAVWAGFPMIMTSAIFGGLVTYHLGFGLGLVAIAAGNAVLVAYVGLLSLIAGRTGESFALVARRTFGSRAYVLVAGLLSTLVIGWFAFQTGIVGEVLSGTVGWSAPLTSLVAGALFVGVTLMGIRALAVIGVWASAAFAVLAVVAVVLASSGIGIGTAISYDGDAGPAALSLGACVTLIIACFIDSGTMTADFTRWARSGREGFLAALAAFPIGNAFAQVTGAAIVGLGAAAAPESSGGDFMAVLVDAGGVLVPIAVVFVFLNMGSVCSHCLYNGAVGWSQLTGRTMRPLTLILGAVGTVTAVAGIYAYFEQWLTLLGAVVPPIGAIIVVDALLVRRGRTDGPTSPVRPAALVAWAVASGSAFAVHFFAPFLSEAVVGIAIAVVAHLLLSRGTRSSRPSSSEPGPLR